MQSGIVILYFALSVFVSRPVSETGWKFTACTTSKFFCPNRMIPPSSWSLIDFITVGTSTTPNPALLHASIAYGASQWFFGFVFGDTPSNDMYRFDAPASLSLFASPGFSARLIPFVLSWMWSTRSEERRVGKEGMMR